MYVLSEWKRENDSGGAVQTGEPNLDWELAAVHAAPGPASPAATPPPPARPGLPSHSFTELAGCPGTGKTAVYLSLAREVLLRGQRVLHVSCNHSRFPFERAHRLPGWKPARFDARVHHVFVTSLEQLLVLAVDSQYALVIVERYDALIRRFWTRAQQQRAYGAALARMAAWRRSACVLATCGAGRHRSPDGAAVVAPHSVVVPRPVPHAVRLLLCRTEDGHSVLSTGLAFAVTATGLASLPPGHADFEVPLPFLSSVPRTTPPRSAITPVSATAQPPGAARRRRSFSTPVRGPLQRRGSPENTLGGATLMQNRAELADNQAGPADNQHDRDHADDTENYFGHENILNYSEDHATYRNSARVAQFHNKRSDGDVDIDTRADHTGSTETDDSTSGNGDHPGGLRDADYAGNNGDLDYARADGDNPDTHVRAYSGANSSIEADLEHSGATTINGDFSNDPSAYPRITSLHHIGANAIRGAHIDTNAGSSAKSTISTRTSTKTGSCTNTLSSASTNTSISSTTGDHTPRLPKGASPGPALPSLEGWHSSPRPTASLYSQAKRVRTHEPEASRPPDRGQVPDHAPASNLPTSDPPREEPTSPPPLSPSRLPGSFIPSSPDEHCFSESALGRPSHPHPALALLPTLDMRPFSAPAAPLAARSRSLQIVEDEALSYIPNSQTEWPNAK